MNVQDQAPRGWNLRASTYLRFLTVPPQIQVVLHLDGSEAYCTFFFFFVKYLKITYPDKHTAR